MTETPIYWFAGVDGGGTGCRVVIDTAAGERLGEATGGPANYTTDPVLTLQSITATLEAAAQKAGLGSDWTAHCAAHFGLAGVMSKEDARCIIQALPFAKIGVSDDRETSVAGALGERDGMLAAIGTGTIIAGQKNGVTRFFGGWGHHLADQASGGWLGRSALRRMMLAYDGLADHSGLTRTLLERFDNDPIAAIDFTSSATPGDFASLAKTVVEAARDRDPAGSELMREGARYLCLCVQTLKLEAEAVICLAGGVGPHYAPYLPKPHRARIRPAQGTAVDGALALARRAIATREGAL